MHKMPRPPFKHELTCDLSSVWRSRPILECIIDIAVRRRMIGPRTRVVLSVAAVSAVEMKKLNRKHRGINKPTDVLSFEQIFGRSPKGYLFLGDLVVCREVLRKQAREHGHSIRAELAVLLTHGFLHLLGWDHERSTREAQRMAKLEDSILAVVSKDCGLPKLRSGLITRTDDIR